MVLCLVAHIYTRFAAYNWISRMLYLWHFPVAYALQNVLL